MSLCKEDRELLESVAKQTNQIHVVLFGAEGQRGLLREMEAIGKRMDEHQVTDTAFQTRMEVKFGKERIATMKLIGASTAMGGLAGTITHKFSAVLDWLKQ